MHLPLQKQKSFTGCLNVTLCVFFWSLCDSSLCRSTLGNTCVVHANYLMFPFRYLFSYFVRSFIKIPLSPPRPCYAKLRFRNGVMLFSAEFSIRKNVMQTVFRIHASNTQTREKSLSLSSLDNMARQARK